MKRSLATFEERTVDDLAIVDERSFDAIDLYRDLKAVLRKDEYVFRVLPRTSSSRWDRALFLNLTYWSGIDGDVLESPRIAADVVAHAAWHHLVTLALPRAARSADALLLGESVASAFDVYLIGRLLRSAPRSSFLETQVSAMAESASAAGLGARAFEALLRGIAADPVGAFEGLRRLLYDATRALAACKGASEALGALAGFDSDRFAPLLHHYELSNWVLYARAYAKHARGMNRGARTLDAALRRQPDPLAWLASRWITPRLAGSGGRSRAVR